MSDPVPNDAARIVEAFGGIRPMAKKLGVAVTTVQGWKERNAIPIRRLDELRAAAEREGIDLGAMADPAGDPVDNGPVDSGSVDNENPAAAAGPVEAEPMRAEKVARAPSGVREAASAAAGPTVDAAPAQPAGRNRTLFFGLGFAGMLILGTLIGWVAAGRGAGQGPDRETVVALEQRIAAAENVAAGAREAAAAAGAQTVVLAERLTAAEAAATALAGKVDAGNDDATLKSLDNSVASLKADLQELRQSIAVARSDRRQADERLAKMAADLADLGTSVADLRKAAAEAAGNSAGRAGEEAALRTAVGELSQKLAALSDRIATVEPNRLANAESALAALAARLSAAETRLNSLKAGGSATGIIVALSQLRAAAATGRPYRDALRVARKLAGGNEAATAILEELEPAAASGAPVVPVLRREFDALSARLVTAAGQAPGEGWIDRTWNRLKSTVVVRRTGRNVAGDSIPALVAQTEIGLADGDLAGSIARIRKMPAAAQKIAAEWLAAAERRAAVDAALAKLDALMPVLSGMASDIESR